MDYNYEEIINIANNDIREIKEFGLQPITLKSPANIIEKLIHPKGTSNEGEFMTYSEYINKFGYISKSEFYDSILEFISNYSSQLNLEGAIDYQADIVLNKVDNKLSDDTIYHLANMDKQDLIELIRMAGYAANVAVRNGATSDVFYYYIEQYIDNYIK